MKTHKVATDWELLREVYKLLAPSNMVNAIYLSESQRLRNMADELERKNDIIRRFKEFLNQNTESNEDKERDSEQTTV